MWLTPAAGSSNVHPILTFPLIEAITYGVFVWWALINLAPWKRDGRRYFELSLLIPLLLLLLGGTIAVIASGGYLTPVFRRFSLYGFFLFLVAFNLPRSILEIQRLMLLIIVSALFIGFLASFSDLQGKWDPYLRIVIQGRSSGFYLPFLDIVAGPVVLATYFSTLVPIALGLGIGAHERWVRLTASIVFLVIGVLLFFAGGRAGWLAATLSTLWILVVMKRIQVSKPGVLAVGLGALIIFSLIISGDINKDITMRTENFQYLFKDISLTTRFLIWKDVIPLAARNPLGIGYVTYQHMNPWGYSPHNEWLAVALGAGWVGLLGYVLFWIRFAAMMSTALLRKSQGEAHTVIVIGTGVALAAMINFLGDAPSVNSPWTPQTLWFVCGLCVASVVKFSARHYSLLPSGH